MKTEVLIQKLSSAPIDCNKRYLSPLNKCLIFFASCILVLIVANLFLPLELGKIWELDKKGLIEVLVLLSLVISSSILSFKSAVPGILGKREKYTPIGIFILWLIMLFFFHKDSHVAVSNEPQIMCAVFVVITGIVLSLLPLLMLKRAACTLPTYSGMNAFFASLGVGLLLLRIICARCDLAHHLLWHLSPMLIVSILMVPMWKKFLKF